MYYYNVANLTLVCSYSFYELALRLAKNLNLQGLMLHNRDRVLDRDWMTAKVRQ